MRNMAIKNRVTAITGRDYPIIQAPMAYISMVIIVAAG